MSFSVKRIGGNVFRLPLACTQAFNADFDLRAIASLSRSRFLLFTPCISRTCCPSLSPLFLHFMYGPRSLRWTRFNCRAMVRPEVCLGCLDQVHGRHR